MTIAKHTQAPWVIAADDKTFVYALGPGGTTLFWLAVAAAGPEKISNDEKEANARLIAAAPDLLAALIGLDESFCTIKEFSSREDRHAARLALIAARAAITKATGAAA